MSAALGSHEEYRGNALALAVLVIGVFMAIMDTSVVNVAIPAMEAALGANTDQIQWVLTGYILVLGMLIPISGWLTDRFGAKRLFLFALALFTLGSALCGLAWDLTSLIGFRVLQGIGGAFMQPVAIALVYRMYPPNRRGTIMGVVGVAITAAPAFGPVLSGYLVDYVSWRYVFYVNVPLGILALALGTRALPEFAGRLLGAFDLPGFLLSIAGFGTLLYGATEAGTYGWHSVHVYPYVMVGAVLVVTLVVVELLRRDPMIDLRILRYGMFSASLLIISMLTVALYAALFFLPIYLQVLRGYTAVQAGLFMTPAALTSAAVMPLSGRLFDRIGARPLAIVGLGVVLLATLGFTQLDMSTPSGSIQLYYILRSLGIGIAMMPIMTAGMNVVPRTATNQASAISNTVRQVVASFGTSLMTTYMTTETYVHAAHMSWAMTPATVAGHTLAMVAALLHAHGVSAAAATPMAAGMLGGYLQEQATVAGMDDAFMWSAILTAVALVVSFFYHSEHERRLRQGEGEPSVAVEIGGD